MTPAQEDEKKVRKSPRHPSRKRGRSDMQMAEDKAEIARLRRAKKSDQEISDILNERDESYMPIGRKTVGNDRNALVADWNQSALADMDRYIEEEVAKLDKVERVAWEGYAMTLATNKAVETLERSRHSGEKEKLAYVERETRTIDSPANPNYQFLRIILECIDKRAKLRGLYKYQAEVNVNVRQETTHHVKHYIGWSPEEWDQKQIEDGEFEPA